LSRAELAVIVDKLVRGAFGRSTHAPWTIEFDFKPEKTVKRFYGKVSSVVYGPPESYLAVKNKQTVQKMWETTVETRTAYVYLAPADLELFTIGDGVQFNYNKENEVTSYQFK
jgi:hypothetical protein